MAAAAEAPKPRRFLSPYEQGQIQADKKFLDASLRNPHVTEKGDVAKALARTEQIESASAPPDLTAEQKDRAAKEIARLEAELQEGLLSPEEMRRGPKMGTGDGAISRNLKWHRKNKFKVERWRNLLKAVNKGMDRHELADLMNVDRLRPRMSHLPMTDCAIPQQRSYSFPSEAFREGYDGIDWTPRTRSPQEEFAASLQPHEDISDEELEQLTRPEPPQMPDFGDCRKPQNKARRDAWLSEHGQPAQE